jgi:hypothetical protein
MRWTAQQYESFLNRNKKADITERKISLTDSENAKKERKKFRAHIRQGNYEFCDSYFMEGLGVDGVNR